MNRIDRLFGMLTLLQSRKYVPAEKIAEKFKISIRTVYRDVKALCESGVPVSFEQYKGYFIVQGYFLSPVAFTPDEANALLLMETMVSAFADQSIHKHYSTALTKIKSVMRSAEKDNIESLSQQIKLQVPDRFYRNVECLSLLQKAVSAKELIELEYENNEMQSSVRKVEPIGLIFYAFSWHLIGWCHLRNDYRDFKITGIKKVRNTGSPFSKTDHMALDEYMKLLPVKY